MPMRLIVAAFLLSTALVAQQKETPMNIQPHHAQGTFTVAVKPLTPGPAETLYRYSINKQIRGDLEATTVGEMYGGGNPAEGVAGYVAIELVTGTLAGKQGSFALQHLATIDPSGQHMTVLVVPGSGTGALKGIAGTFTIVIEGTTHTYNLDYTLPSIAP